MQLLPKILSESKKCFVCLLFFLLLFSFPAKLIGNSPNTAALVLWRYPQDVEAEVAKLLDFQVQLKTSFPSASAQIYRRPVDIVPESLHLLLSSFMYGTPEVIEQAEKRNEVLLVMLENMSQRSGEWHFVYIRLLMNRTIFLSIRGNYVRAVYWYYRTVSALDEGLNKFPSFAPFHALGKINNQIYSAFIEYDPKIRYLLPSPVKIDPSLSQHGWSASETPLWQFISAMFEISRNDSLSVLTNYSSQAEKILLVSYLLSKREAKKVVEVLEQPGKSPMDDFYGAWAYLTLGKYDKAALLFDKHIQTTLPYIHKRAACLGLFYMDIINNNGRNKAALTKKMEGFPKTTAYRDNVAEREIQKEHHPVLLKARLLSDGGEWDKTLEVLQAVEPEKLAGQFRIEYFYRLGRVYFFQQNYDAAIRAYTIVLNPELPDVSYFKAQAAYDCGVIYERQKQTAKAKEMYGKSATLAAKAKRTDIEQMAKRALNRL